MTVSKKTFQPQSFADLLELVQPGKLLILSVGVVAEARYLLPPLLHETARATKALLLGSPEVADLPDAVVCLDLKGVRNAAALLDRTRRTVKKMPRVKTLFLDGGSVFPALARSERQRLELVDSLRKLAQQMRLRMVCLVPRENGSASFMASLKDEADVFLHVERRGVDLHASLLTARGYYPSPLESEWKLLPHANTVSFLTRGESLESADGTVYHRAFEVASGALAIIELDGPFRSFNKKALDLLGYTEAELCVLPLSALLIPGNTFGLLRILHQVRKRSRTSGGCTIRRRDGKQIDLSVSARDIGDGRILVGFADISGQRKLEHDLRNEHDFLQSLSAATPHPVMLVRNRKVTFVNKAFSAMFTWVNAKGLTLTELLGRGNAAIAKTLASLGENPEDPVEPFRSTIEVPSAEGKSRSFDLSAMPLELAGKRYVHCTFVDVTIRETALATLRNSEEYLRGVVEDAMSAVSLVRERNIVWVNKAFLELFGIANIDDVIGKDAAQYGGERKEGEKKRGKKPYADGTMRFVEYEAAGRAGSRIVVEAQVSRVVLGGLPTEVYYHREITERKRLEHDLKERARTMALVDEITRSVHAVISLDDVLQRILSSTIKGLSQEFGAVYLQEEGSGDFVIGLEKGLPERVASILNRQSNTEGITGFVMKTQEPLILTPAEYPPHLPYRSLFASESLATVVYLPLVADATVVGILLLGSRKARPLTISQEGILHALRDQLGGAVRNARQFTSLSIAEERYRSSIENISDVIYHASPAGGFHFMSPNVERFLGYTPQEFYRSADLWRTVLHPDDRSKYSQRISNQTSDVDDFHIEYRVLPKGKAAYRWVRDSIRYHRDSNGAVAAINGIISDITDRVELETALIKSEGLKTNVLESVQEGVMVLDPAMTYIDWNSAMGVVTGIQREEVIGRNAFEATPALMGEDLRNLLNRALKGEAVSSEDIPFEGLPGEEARFFWVRYSPLRDSAGSIRGVVGILTDITARKRLEHEVKESEETLRNVIDAMGDALMISDLQGRVWEVNKEFASVTGYARSEALGLDFPYPWVVDEEMAKFVKWIAELRERSYLRDFDMTWRRKDGNLFAISLNTTMLRNALGEPVAMLNIARDISERQRLSGELERKNLQIELLNRIIGKANTTMNFGDIFETIAREVLLLIPYDQISVGLLSDDRSSIIVYACSSPSGIPNPEQKVVPLEETVSKLAVQRGKPVVVDDLLEAEGLTNGTLSIREGLRSQICIPFHLHETVIGTFSIASRAVQSFTGEELKVLQPIADQIGAMIDRVRLFQKVSDDAAYIHNLVNSIESVVFTVDEQYRVTEANASWREFAALQGLESFVQEENIIGRPLADLTRDSELLGVYNKVMPQLFAREIDVFSQEFDLRKEEKFISYHLVITPMTINERVTGLVFTLTDITELKRNEEQLRQRNRELIALNAISTSISTSLELDAVLRVASEQIRDIIGADIVMFYLRDEQRDSLVLARSLGLDEAQAHILTVLPTSASATGAVVLNKEPLYIHDSVEGDQRVTRDGRAVFAALGISSLGAIPLQSKDKVLGAMDVAFRASHTFSEQERQLLLLVGNQIGAVIENAQLYAEVQAQVQRITSLYELGKSLTGALDTTTLIRAVATEVLRALPVERFVYFAFIQERHSLKVVYEQGPNDNRTECRPGDEELVSEDSSLWNVVTQGLAIRQNQSPKGSFLAVPVKTADRVTGILQTSVSYPGAYSSAHLRLLESIANLTEIAIERARLYEDTISKSLEIEERNKELDDFTYVVSHDLKEPLISIEGYSKILLKDYEDRVDGDGREYLASVVHSSARMKSLIDDLLTLSRLGRVSENLHIVSTAQVVKEILHELRFMLQEKHVTVEVPDELPEIRYNATQLSMIFRNLISNGIKFNSKPEPRIVINCESLDNEYQFSLSDNGIGIEPQYFEKIFMIFQRLQRSEEYRGTGAGLTIVKKIVEKHHGRIWVESTVGEGTTFRFTVPR